MNFIYLNGDILPDDEAKISVLDRSFLFGEGVFETLRSYGGQTPFLEEHLKRLEYSALFLNIPYPTEINFNEVIQKLLEKTNLKDARLKIILTKLNTCVFCEKIDAKSYPKTYKLKIIEQVTNDNPRLAAVKTTSRLTKLVGYAEAQEAGFEDGILLNNKGQVTEGTRGNLFWVDENSELKTVLQDCGILCGITRQELMKVLKAKNLKIKEDIVTPEKLSNMKEVFYTSSIAGIKPVVQIDKRKISGGEPGDVTLMLQDLWERHVQELLE